MSAENIYCPRSSNVSPEHNDGMCRSAVRPCEATGNCGRTGCRRGRKIKIQGLSLWTEPKQAQRRGGRTRGRQAVRYDESTTDRRAGERTPDKQKG